MNILITGSSGQLGSEIRFLKSSFPEHNFFFTDAKELDISNKRTVEDFVIKNRIDSVINCAAYTAVDKAESEPELADKINHVAVQFLAEIAKKHGVRLVHISTDYVFNGETFRPYAVDHPTNPINVYGETKLNGENALKEINPKNSTIIRTSWVYSSFGNNFVKTMLRLGKEREELNVISDQIGVPTYARDLAKFILKNALNIQNETVSVYHFTNEGVCSWYDFAQEIMELGKVKCKVNPIPTSAYPTPAKRPFYSLMDKTTLKEDFGVEIPYWKDSLKKCIFGNAIGFKL
ncbi:MAG TPA: dTDP-4-dehydrorhamnose reductase [Flavobacteriaceae bacterium]|nr:dTDP-4-dehydrorhamnose reductase [Flavobacteriaceae bacterium]